jgi:hypothetical protein
MPTVYLLSAAARIGRQRPRYSRAPEQRDESAALQRRDHSITSSARTSSVIGN